MSDFAEFCESLGVPLNPGPAASTYKEAMDIEVDGVVELFRSAVINY